MTAEMVLALPTDLETVVDIAGTLVTAAAVIIGGLWAYFRFIKDRVYRPRLEVGLFGQWRQLSGRPVLHARVTVKNIGATDVELLQEGTGLTVKRGVDVQPVPPAATAWEPVAAFSILEDHQWIEPNETVSDDLLLRLGVATPEPTLFRASLRWKFGSTDKSIVIVVARKIIPGESSSTARK